MADARVGEAGRLDAGQGRTAVRVWYQLAGTGSGGSANVPSVDRGQIPVGEKKE